jgi:hypothetical protein
MESTHPHPFAQALAQLILRYSQEHEMEPLELVDELANCAAMVMAGAMRSLGIGEEQLGAFWAHCETNMRSATLDCLATYGDDWQRPLHELVAFYDGA